MSMTRREFLGALAAAAAAPFVPFEPEVWKDAGPVRIISGMHYVQTFEHVVEPRRIVVIDEFDWMDREVYEKVISGFTDGGRAHHAAS